MKKHVCRVFLVMGVAVASFAQEVSIPVPPEPPAPPVPAVEVFTSPAAEAAERSAELMARQAEIMAHKAEMSAFNSVEGRLGFALLAQAAPSPAPLPPKAPMPPGRGFKMMKDREDRSYRRGTEALDRREWEKAVDIFNEVIDQKESKAEGAYYWKAYALSRLGRRDQVLATIAELHKNYPSSRWLNDAKALEAEMAQSGGKGVSPEKENDEDLKLLAINSLVNSEPERTIPLLDKILKQNGSPKIKERALFVLAQIRSPKARDVVAQFARGSGNPDLQTKAVEYLGIYGGKENLQLLADVYGGTSDAGIKRNILRSYMMAGDRDRLLAAAKGEQNPALRRDAIHLLGTMGASAEVAELYKSEPNMEVREAALEAMFIAGNAEKLAEVARSEKEPKLRLAAIQRLGMMGRSKTGETLVSLYSSETDKAVRGRIINALFTQGSAKDLADIARKETDPSLKKDAVQKLSMMKSKDATDYLMELLSK